MRTSTASGSIPSTIRDREEPFRRCYRMAVQQPSVDAVRSYVDWLSTGRPQGARYADELLALSGAAREQHFRTVPLEMIAHTLEGLSRRAADGLLRAPAETAELTEFVVDHLPDAVVPTGLGLVLTLLQSTAWRERANALRAIGDLPHALAAANRAVSLLLDEPALDLELEMARRVAAFVRHQMGESGEPLAIIRAGRSVFQAHNDVAGELRSRTFEGFIQFDHGLMAEAMTLFEEALDLAEAIEDHTTLASLHNNIGHCAERLGQPAKAVDHLVVALKLFEIYGMASERPRAIWGLAEVAAGAGRTDHAIGQLRVVAEELFDRGMPLESARVWLDVADLLVRAQRYREAEMLAADLAATFRQAGAPREAGKAMEQLRAAVSQLFPTSSDVEVVWETLNTGG